MIKSVCADRIKSVREGDAGDSEALIKSVVTDLTEPGADGKSFNARALPKRLLSDRGEGIGEVYFSQRFAAREGSWADR